MEKKIQYTCAKCGWRGAATNAFFPMHPAAGDGPRCPKCFTSLLDSEKVKAANG